MGEYRTALARDFSAKFLQNDGRPKYVFGCNTYGEALAKCAPICGFIDDFTDSAEFYGLPVVRLADVPNDALVLVASGGRPFSAIERVKRAGFECLDYFAFYRWSGLPLREVVFNEGFAGDYHLHPDKYAEMYLSLADHELRAGVPEADQFSLTYDLDQLRGFTAREDMPVFDEFLKLKTATRPSLMSAALTANKYRIHPAVSRIPCCLYI